MHRDSLPARRRYTRLSGSADALALSRLAQEEKPLAVVTATALDAQRLVEELALARAAAAHLPAARLGNPALRPALAAPGPGVRAPGDAVPHPARRLRRRRRARAHRAGAPVPAEPTSPAAPSSSAPARSSTSRRCKQQLVVAGYQHVTQVVAPGEFCFRGGLIDLFPTGSALPYRLDLDDDVVEAIKTFDVDSQRTLYSVKDVRMLPAREFPFDEAGRAQWRSRWRELFEGDPSKRRLYKDVSSGIPSAGIEYYLPLFFESVATLVRLPAKGRMRETPPPLVLHGDVAEAVAGVLARRHLALQAARRRRRPAAAAAGAALRPGGGILRPGEGFRACRPVAGRRRGEGSAARLRSRCRRSRSIAARRIRSPR